MKVSYILLVQYLFVLSHIQVLNTILGSVGDKYCKMRSTCSMNFKNIFTYVHMYIHTVTTRSI